MKLILAYLYLICAVCAPSYAYAASTAPDTVAKEIISKVQQTKSLLVLLPYVHWETAFRKLPESDRTALQVRTASDLRERYRQLISNPSTYFREQLQPKLPQSLPAGLIGSLAETVAEGFGASVREFERRAVAAKYTVGPSAIKQTNAIVPVSVLVNGASQQRQVQFSKIDGKWYLPSPEALDKSGIIKSALTGNLMQNLKLPQL